MGPMSRGWWAALGCFCAWLAALPGASPQQIPDDLPWQTCLLANGSISVNQCDEWMYFSFVTSDTSFGYSVTQLSAANASMVTHRPLGWQQVYDFRNPDFDYIYACNPSYSMGDQGLPECGDALLASTGRYQTSDTERTVTFGLQRCRPDAACPLVVTVFGMNGAVCGNLQRQYTALACEVISPDAASTARLAAGSVMAVLFLLVWLVD
eukprot:EG_transcript_23621